jgi:mannose-1-phosphate guanylyltransferase
VEVAGGVRFRESATYHDQSYSQRPTSLQHLEEATFLEEATMPLPVIYPDSAIMENSSEVYKISCKVQLERFGNLGSLFDTNLDKNEQHNAVRNAEVLGIERSGNTIRNQHRQKKKYLFKRLEDYIIVDQDDILHDHLLNRRTGN